jgi:hypothetical protein
MNVNGKMRPIESIPGMGEGRDKGDSRGNSIMIYLIFCRNF